MNYEALWEKSCERAGIEAALMFPAGKDRTIIYAKLVWHYFGQYTGRRT